MTTKLLSLCLILLSCLIFTTTNSVSVHAQDNQCANASALNLDAIERCLAESQKALDMSVRATKPLESQLKGMLAEITGIKNRVSAIEKDIATKKKNIDEGYKDLARQQTILAEAIRNFYIESHNDSPLLIFLSASSASEVTQLLAYERAATDQNKAIITNIAGSIVDLEEKKENLESEQVHLVAIKAKLDEQSAQLDKVVGGAKAYQSTLSSQIAQLSARQKEILGQRLASLNISRSAASIELAAMIDI